jgi:glucose-6-phosphate 1-epimerase
MVGICWYKNSWRVSINAQYIKKTAIGFELDHPLFDAIILKQGAQLIHFQPKGGSALFWKADLSTFEAGKAFRGGIPLCWPWFGKAGNPTHGFARIMEWEIVLHVENEEGVQLVFELHDSATTRAIWPYAFFLRLEMNLGREVALTLHINTEKESTGALHTYFSCDAIHNVYVTGLGYHYTDALQNGKRCESEDDMLQVNHALDRIYTQPQSNIVFTDTKRRVSVSQKNHSDVVVWNPWKEGAAKLSDMKKDDYTRMLCVESARISKPFNDDDSLQITIHVEEIS